MVLWTGVVVRTEFNEQEFHRVGSGALYQGGSREKSNAVIKGRNLGYDAGEKCSKLGRYWACHLRDEEDMSPVHRLTVA
jgi:hypothetical protein